MKTLMLLFTCAGLSLLTACQSTNEPLVTENSEVNQQTSYFIEAKIALDKLEKDISQGRDDQLTYFAPGTFEQAVAEFDNATEEYMDIGQNGASSLNVFQNDTEQYKSAKEEIINYIALANQKLKFSYSIKETAESTLGETFSQRALLEVIGAPKVFPEDYRVMSDRVDDLVEYIDEGAVSTAQEKQVKLLSDMQALEVRTVRENELGQLDRDIDYINKKLLAKYVPISYKQLLAARHHANEIITVSPRRTSEIKVAVELAEFQLAHFYQISKEVNVLKKTKFKYYEQYLLDKEAQLHAVSDSLGLDDIRNLSMDKQVDAIALQAATIKGKLTTANVAILALQSDSSQSSAATESLRTEFKAQLIDLNAKYDALVIENSGLNKQMQEKDIELARLEAYKEGVLHVESKHATEKEHALQEQAKTEADPKALASVEKEAKEPLASVVQEKKEVDQNIPSLDAEPNKNEEVKVIEEQAKQDAEVKVIEENSHQDSEEKALEEKLKKDAEAKIEVKTEPVVQ